MVGFSRMLADYVGALAEARRACSALRPSDALRAKIEPELRKIEDAAEHGLLCDERIEEALLANPIQFKWQGDVSRAPARDAAPRQAALAAWKTFSTLFWPPSTSTERVQRKRESPVYVANEHMSRTVRRVRAREDALDVAAGVDPPSKRKESEPGSSGVFGRLN